jgi:hypothetical protein
VSDRAVDPFQLGEQQLAPDTHCATIRRRSPGALRRISGTREASVDAGEGKTPSSAPLVHDKKED